MKNIVSKWWFWAIAATVVVIVYLNRNDKELSVKLSDKPVTEPTTV